MLTLPADLEPYADSIAAMHEPGAYALVLAQPDDLVAQWDARFDHRPGWVAEAADSDTVCYVGGSQDILSRLEDHREGSVRVPVLTRLCDIERLQTVVWADSDTYEHVEYNLAATLRDERPGWFIRQR
jgi:hypothetical protein